MARVTCGNIPSPVTALALAVVLACGSCVPPTPATFCVDQSQCPHGFRCEQVWHFCVVDDAGSTGIQDAASDAAFADSRGDVSVDGGVDGGADGSGVDGGGSDDSGADAGADAGWYIQVATGYGHTCAIKSDNTLWCWGDNSAGQLGDGTTESKQTPAPVAGTAWSSVAASWFHTCAVKTDGTLYCWGGNYDGQLGDGTTRNKQTPAQVAGTTWSSVAAGETHTCALQTGHTLWCWGDNLFGQLGVNGGSRMSPVQVP